MNDQSPPKPSKPLPPFLQQKMVERGVRKAMRGGVKKARGKEWDGPRLTFEDQGARYRYNYTKLFDDLNDMVSKGDAKGFRNLYGTMCMQDMFFFLHVCIGLKDINHPWIVERIKEVEENHYFTLDLWPRFHYKSTILTFGLPIQLLLNNPEERICIFSHTKTHAEKYLKRIKETFEDNKFLKVLFPNILYQNPAVESPQWSIEKGITVKRRGTFLEASIEAHGIEKLPTGNHYTKRIYDDIEVGENTTTPEMIAKTESSFRISEALMDGSRNSASVAGTIYHFAGLHYNVLLKDPTWHPRVYAATEDGMAMGKSVLLPQDVLGSLRGRLGPYHFASQLLMNPVADEMQEFKADWIKYWRNLPAPITKYILVDPASSKKRGSDYTVIAVVGLDTLDNYYLVDMVRARMNLKERWVALKEMVTMHPDIRLVGYEKYAMQADREYFNQMMRQEAFNFSIEDLGGPLAKKERIRRLVPSFASGRFYLPYSLQVDGEDLTKTFVEDEYLKFPYCAHDDMLDAISRIYDETLGATKPQFFPEQKAERYSNVPKRRGTWMAA